MDDLKILINVGINQGKAIGSINDQIKALEKHPSLQKIKLKIEIDKSFTNSINSFINAVGKMKKISDEQSKVVSETENVYKKLDGTIETVTQKVLKNGEILEKTRRVHDENKKAMQDESIAAQKLADNIEKQNKVDLDSITILRNKANAIKGFRVTSSQGYTVTSQSLESDGQTLIGSSAITNYKKEREDQLKEQQRLNKESEALDRAHFQAIKDNNKKVEEMEKLHYLALQQNQQKDLEFQQRVSAQRAKIADAQRRFGADSNLSSSLSDLDARTTKIVQVKDINDTEGYRDKLKNVDTELKNIISSSKNATSSMIGFSEALRTSFVKFPVWLISGTIFVNLTRFFTEGISYANQLNDSLTQISIVTGKNQQQVAALGQEYSNLSKELSVTTLAISQAATEFYRQGLSQAEVMERVKVSTEYAKISNLSFTDSVDILTAAVNSMNIPIEKATDVFSYLGDATATGKHMCPLAS